MSGNDRVQYSIPDPGFHAKEAVNILRASVQMAGKNNRVFGVTSALANEGKSSLAFRLAVSLSSLEEKQVILVDCDIRNTKTKQRLKIVQKVVGLSEYLCGMNHLEEVICNTQNPQLDILFAGKYAPNPSELLSGETFANLLIRLKKQYDFVIVDMPPVNLVVDASLVAPLCDSNVFIVECGVTDKREINHAIDVLRRADAKILGIVLNRIDSKQNSYGKYGRYGHYAKYGHYNKYGKYGYEKYGRDDKDEKGLE